MTPQEQLDRVLEKGWLTNQALKHEVFGLVARAFSAADEEVRAQFIDKAMAVMTSTRPDPDHDEEQTDAYERYNLLVWLARSAPGSVVTKQRLEAEQNQYPMFERREHPDLSHWSSGAHWVHHVAPTNVEELLQSPARENLDWLLTFERSGDPFEGPDREGLLNAVSDAIKTSYQWGWDLANGLASHRHEDDRGLWAAILGAWSKSSLTAEQWTQLLGFLNATPAVEQKASRAVADLLEHSVEQDSTIPNRLVQIVIEMAERLVARQDLKDGVIPQEPIDWLLLAINHTAGRAMITWLRALGRLRGHAGDAWTALPGLERARLDRVIQASGQSAERARTIIASQSHFLFAMDQAWWRDVVLPLFDWVRDDAGAAQAWSGYLQWGRWHSALFAAMRPYFEQTFERIGKRLPGLVDRLGEWLASMAVYSTESPWQPDGWLRKFALISAPATRAAWTRHTAFDLRDLDAEAVTKAWNTWIHDYWKDRLSGVPRALSEDERIEMIEWVPRLAPVGEEVVDLFERMNVSLPEHTSVFFELVEHEIASKHPQAMARFVRHLLRNTRQLQWECEHVDRVVRSLIAASADRAVVTGVIEEMARLKCPSASVLLGLATR